MGQTVHLFQALPAPPTPVRREEVQPPGRPEQESIPVQDGTAHGLTAGRLGIWILIASEIVIFAGLIGSFILFRMAHPEWAPEARHLSLVAGTLNTFLLLASNFFMMKASSAVERQKPHEVKDYLFFTQFLGVAFLMVKAYEYAKEFAHGAFPSSGNFWSFYFLLTGIHALHILGGLVAIGLLFRMTLKGTLEQVKGRVALTGLYWSFVEVVWVFLFPLLYLLE